MPSGFEKYSSISFLDINLVFKRNPGGALFFYDSFSKAYGEMQKCESVVKVLHNHNFVKIEDTVCITQRL